MSATVTIIPRIACFGTPSFKLKQAHSPSPMAKVVVTVYSSLRSIDGLDEAGSAGGQTLPGIAAPIFTTGFLGIATPIVAIGATGAVNESLERFQNYPDTLQKLSLCQQRIIDLVRRTTDAEPGIHNARQHTYLNALIAASAKFDQAKKSHRDNDAIFSKNPFSQPGAVDSCRFLKTALAWCSASIVPSAELLHEIKQYQLLDAQRKIEKSDRNASVAGAVAMTGMTTGMLIATASSAAEIVAKANVVAAEAVADGLLTTAGAVFFPAQAAMMAYGASKVVSGIRYRQQLQQDKQILSVRSSNTPRSAPMTNSLAQVLRRQTAYENHKISYGTATALGQACMLAGNVSSLTGAGIVTAAPLFALGIPLTLGAAIQRIVYEKREQNFCGSGASSSAEEQAKQHNLDVLQRKGSLPEAQATIERKYDDHRYAVARAKLFSLVDHVLATEQKKAKSIVSSPTAKQRLQRQRHLEAMLPTGKKSLLRGTSLLKDDLQLMSDIWHQLPNKDEMLFSSSIDIRARMARELAGEGAISTLSGRQRQKVLQQTVSDLIRCSKQRQASEIRAYLQEHADSGTAIGLGNLQEFAKRNDQTNTIYHQHLAKTLIRRNKNDSKFLRHDAAKELFKTWHSQQEIAAQRRPVEVV